MAKIKGENITVFAYTRGQWRTRAYGTSCEVNINVEYVRAGNPNSGKFPIKKPRIIDWRINCAKLLSDLGDDLYNELRNGTTFAVRFTTVDSHLSPQTGLPNYTPNSKFQLVGEVIITKYTVTGKHRNFATVSMTLDGSGELNRVAY